MTPRNIQTAEDRPIASMGTIDERDKERRYLERSRGFLDDINCTPSREREKERERERES